MNAPQTPDSMITKRIRALPHLFESRSLHELRDWLQANSDNPDIPGALTPELMIELGFSERTLEDEESYIGQDESHKLARLRNIATPKQIPILDRAPRPIAQNEDEILVMENGEYRVDSWGEYGCAAADVIRDLIDPAHYGAEEYVRMMSGETRGIVI